MASKNQSTYVTCRERWKHLRPFEKRRQHNRERLASNKLIAKEVDSIAK